MFAVLEFDRNPLQLSDLPGGVISWLQSAGGFAVVAAVLWLLVGMPKLRPSEWARVPRWQRSFFLVCCLAAVVLDAVWVILYLATPAEPPPAPDAVRPPPPLIARVADWVLAAGGLMAVLAVLTPLIGDLSKLRWRRIFA